MKENQVKTPSKVSPKEYEVQVKDWLQNTASGLRNFHTSHLKMLDGPGGAYEIDIVAELEILQGALITVLVECKHYSHPVKRDVVMVLDAKLREVGAHKGMLFTTSTFQKGALEYAKAHGIATVLFRDGQVLYETKAKYPISTKPPPWSPNYRYIGWLVSLTNEGNESRHLIADDYHEAIREWLHPDTQG